MGNIWDAGESDEHQEPSSQPQIPGQEAILGMLRGEHFLHSVFPCADNQQLIPIACEVRMESLTYLLAHNTHLLSKEVQ